MKPKLILITGGSASGKTFLAKKIKKILNDSALLLSEDSFYKPGGTSDTNFDEPQAFDEELELKVISSLKNNKEIEVPTYDFISRSRTKWTKTQPTEFIILEGLFVFLRKELEKMADFKIYVDTPSDIRLIRRIKRDLNERNTSIEETFKKWQENVQPSYIEYIYNRKPEADVIVPWEKINEKSIKSLVMTILTLNNSVDEIIKKYL